MANVLLGPVRDLWKRVADWVAGTTVDKPAVTVHGSDDGGTTRRVVRTDADGNLHVALTGNFDTLRTPAVGRRTVTATAAELFAGASRLASRRRLVIRNEDPVLRCLIGPATVSQQTGFPIEPGAVLEVPCDPEVAVPVYAISEGASLTVAVMEI